MRYQGLRQYLLSRVLFDESVLIKRGINYVRVTDNADYGLMNIVNKVERCLTVAELFKHRPFCAIQNWNEFTV